MTMVSLTLMLMTAAELSLDVSAAVPCVTSASLEEALAQRGVRVTKASASMLNVKVRGDATRVSLSGARGSQKFERSVPVAKGDCDAVTRVTLALLESWATTSRVSVASSRSGAPVAMSNDAGFAERVGSTRESSVADAGVAIERDAPQVALVEAGIANERVARGSADAGVQDEHAATRGTAGVTNEPDATRGLAVADAGVQDERAATRGTAVVTTEPDATRGLADIDAGVAATRDPSDVAAEIATERAAIVERVGTTPGTSSVDVGVASVQTATERAPLSLEVIVLGGVAYDPLHVLPGSQVTTGTGQLALRGAIGRWGLLLDGGFDSARSHTISTATATGSTQWLSLSLSVAFQPLERFSFDLALGVRGWRLAAVSTGVDVPTENSQFTGGGVFSVGLNLQIVGPLHLQLRPWTSLRAARVHFTVDPLGPILPIEPWTLGVLAGALLRFN